MTTPLTRLLHLVPPPAEAPPATDWADVERRLGHGLPADYKELADTYGHGRFDRHITLLVPEDSRAGQGLITRNDGYTEELEDRWEMHEEWPDEVTEEAGTTLVVWAGTKDAGDLTWLVRPGTPPDSWPVMVFIDDLTEWETYPLTATAFLAGLLAGDIDSPILSSELTPPEHTFSPYPR